MATYKAQHVYDAVPSKSDHRDFRVSYVDTSLLNPTIMLPQVSILDQGREGACVGHGCAGARETLEVIANSALPMTPLSRAFIYYRARLLEGTADQDSGAQVRDGCKVMTDDGVCTEDLFPYKVGGFKDVPPDLDIAAAAQYKILTYTRLNSSDEVWSELNNLHPVIIGIAVHKSFETQIGKDGRVPIPTPDDPLLGYHCTYINGRTIDPQSTNSGGRFRMPNSWGEGFGDAGNGWLPDAYLNNPNLCTDMWAIAIG